MTTALPSAPPATAQAILDDLSSLADTVYALAGDVAGLGDAAVKNDIEDRVRGLKEAADAVAADLRAKREPHLRAALASLDAEAPYKLNLGAGQTRVEGWVHIDVAPAEVPMDVRWGLPFPDGSVSHVYMAHVLEHLYFAKEVVPVLKEVRRVLAPGGRVRIAVPDIERYLRAYADGDEAFFEARARVFHWLPKPPTRLAGFLAYAGACPRPGSLFESHKYGYDFETLAYILKYVGFTSVDRSEYQQSADSAFHLDDSSAIAGATHAGRSLSLFVEAEA